MAKSKSNTELNIYELSIEQSFEKIEELMNDMGDDDISLEASFEKYKLGMDLLKHCSEQIDTVEKRIQILENSDNQ